MDNHDAIAVIRVVNAACDRYEQMSRNVQGHMLRIEQYCKDLRQYVDNFGAGNKEFEALMRPLLRKLDVILAETTNTSVHIDDDDNDYCYDDDDVAAGEVC